MSTKPKTSLRPFVSSYNVIAFVANLLLKKCTGKVHIFHGNVPVVITSGSTVLLSTKMYSSCHNISECIITTVGGNVCFRGKINDIIAPAPISGLIDESRRAVFKCVSVNTVRPV